MLSWLPRSLSPLLCRTLPSRSFSHYYPRPRRRAHYQAVTAPMSRQWRWYGFQMLERKSRRIYYARVCRAWLARTRGSRLRIILLFLYYHTGLYDNTTLVGNLTAYNAAKSAIWDAPAIFLKSRNIKDRKLRLQLHRYSFSEFCSHCGKYSTSTAPAQ